MDGITWVEGTISDNAKSWNSVSYGNNQFVAVASNTTSLSYSVDGINWSELTIGEDITSYSSVAYGNGKFVIGIEGANSIGICSEISPIY